MAHLDWGWSGFLRSLGSDLLGSLRSDLLRSLRSDWLRLLLLVSSGSGDLGSGGGDAQRLLSSLRGNSLKGNEKDSARSTYPTNY